VFIAFSGGPGAAREAYLTRGSKLFRVGIPVVYLVLGIGVPAAVIATRSEAEGGSAGLRSSDLSPKLQRGKDLFRQTCATCHTLAAVNAHGITGPNLDQLGQIDKQRVLNAIRRGGTGQGRMPAGLLQGADADAVATYVARVAGK
jgi:mono/diheme cytochrome c family protein